MNIYNDPNDLQKRFELKISGLRGSGYTEIFSNKKLEEFIKKIQSYLINFSRKNNSKTTDGI